MAMPTSAAASAGASLTPSPTMATRRPSSRSRCTTSLLRSGNTPASISSMPSVFATARAVVRLSPVSITMRRPSPRNACSAALRRRLDRIGDRDHAGGAAVDRHIDRGGAILPRGFGGAVEIRGRDVQFAHQHRIAERDLPAVDGPGRALAGRRREVADRAERKFALAWRRCRIACASGCSLPRSTLAASRSNSFSSKPSAAIDRRRPSACPRSACRSCRSRAYRCSRTAPAPRRRGSGFRHARRARRRP